MPLFRGIHIGSFPSSLCSVWLDIDIDDIATWSANYPLCGRSSWRDNWVVHFPVCHTSHLTILGKNRTPTESQPWGPCYVGLLPAVLKCSLSTAAYSLFPWDVLPSPAPGPFLLACLEDSKFSINLCLKKWINERMTHSLKSCSLLSITKKLFQISLVEVSLSLTLKLDVCALFSSRSEDNSFCF